MGELSPLQELRDQLQGAQQELADLYEKRDGIRRRDAEIATEISNVRTSIYALQEQIKAYTNAHGGVSAAEAIPGNSIDSLDLSTEALELFGRKGLGFRTIDQFRGEQYNVSILESQLSGLMERLSHVSGSAYVDMNTTERKAKAAELVTQLQKALSHYSISLE